MVRDNLDTLKNINSLLLFFKNPRGMEFEQIILQYERFLQAELDYTQELNNMVLFHDALADMSDMVRVPRVYPALSTPSMLVMEYMPSIKITDIDAMARHGIDRKAVCDRLISVFMTQIIVKGIVHNDTQQGNIGVLVGSDSTGVIVLYDFGNVITFSKEFTDSIGLIAFIMLQKDTDEFVDLLVELDVLYVGGAEDLREVKKFFKYLLTYLDGMDMVALKESVMQSDIKGQFQNLKIKPDFLALFRVFSLLDGTIARLDPNFSYIDALQPFTKIMFNNPIFMDMKARRDIMHLLQGGRSSNGNVRRKQR